MSHYQKLTGDRCYLSPCETEDAETWARWMNDLEITLPLGDEAYQTWSLETTQQSLAEMLQSQMAVFDIITCAEDRLIGRTMLFGVDHINRSCMLGLLIGEKDCWNQGYGEESLHLLLDYAFNLLNLNSVMLGVFEFNQPAIRCYEKVGFKLIGRRRQARIIAGKPYDAIFMDILASEFGSPYLCKAFPWL